MAHDYLDPNCNTQQKWSNHGPYENLLGLYERLNKYGTMGYGSNIYPDFLTTFHEFLVLFMQWQNFNTTTYSSEFRLWYEILLAIGSNQVNVLLPHTVMLLTKESDTTTWKLPLCGKNDILCLTPFIWTVNPHFSELLKWSNHTFLTPFNTPPP